MKNKESTIPVQVSGYINKLFGNEKKTAGTITRSMKKTASNTEKIVLETVWLWIEKTALSILQKLKLDEAFVYVIH